MTRAVRAAGAVLALVCVASTAACSDDDARNATTAAAEAPRCVVSDPQGELILHPGSVTAPASGTTLDGVDLTDADNVEVEQTFTVAFSGIPSVRGVILDYPPMKNAGLADSLADWDQRQPLEGRTITADDGQQAILVVVRLSDPA